MKPWCRSRRRFGYSLAWRRGSSPRCCTAYVWAVTELLCEGVRHRLTKATSADTMQPDFDVGT